MYLVNKFIEDERNNNSRRRNRKFKFLMREDIDLFKMVLNASLVDFSSQDFNPDHLEYEKSLGRRIGGAGL